MASRQRVEVGGVRWWLRTGEAPGPACARIESALRALAAGAVNVKTGRRKELYPLALDGAAGDRDAADHLLKVNHYRPYHAWRRAALQQGSKSRHELEMAERVASRGVPTPVPLAAGEQWAGGRLRSCFLLSELLPDVSDLRRLWLDATRSPRRRRAVTAAFGAMTRAVHATGVYQPDFAPNNFLVGPGDAPRLYMIDFERARLRAGNAPEARRFMLAKIEREAGSAAGLAARWRFLLAYAGQDAATARRWFRQVQAQAPRLARRDWERVTRNTLSKGRDRHLREVPGWAGWYLGDPPKPAALGALEALPRVRSAAGGPAVERVPGFEDLWCTIDRDTGDRAGAAVWAMARLLHERGLGPAPRAWLRHGGRSLLLLSAPGSRQARDPSETDEAAVRVLVRRLLALGELTALPGPDLVALQPGPGLAPRARLLAPQLVRFAGRPGRIPRSA